MNCFGCEKYVKQLAQKDQQILNLESNIKQLCIDQQKQLASQKRVIEVYEKALEKITQVELSPKNGQIVSSEHYECAWLECYEIARAALTRLREGA